MPKLRFFNVANVSFNAIRKNKISYSGKFPNLQKISKFTVCSSATYIANIMNPDQTAPEGAIWSGFMVFASMIKYSLKCTTLHDKHNIFRKKILVG